MVCSNYMDVYETSGDIACPSELHADQQWPPLGNGRARGRYRSFKTVDENRTIGRSRGGLSTRIPAPDDVLANADGCHLAGGPARNDALDVAQRVIERRGREPVVG